MTRPYYFLGGNRALTQLSTGEPFFVNTDDRGITTWIILGGVWETFVDDVLCRLARPGMNFLDVGAHIGYYSVKMGKLIGPNGGIFSFEPNPELYPFLRDNIEINGLSSRTRTFQIAVGDGEGSGELKFDYGNMGGGNLFGRPQPHRTATVGVTTLDRCIPAGTRIDLVKIDAEGCEPQILAGAKRLVAENPDMLVVLEASIACWRTFTDSREVLCSLVGSKRALFRIEFGGGLTPMENVDEFLHGMERASEDAAYCFICPKSFPADEVLAGLLHGTAADTEGGRL